MRYEDYMDGLKGKDSSDDCGNYKPIKLEDVIGKYTGKTPSVNKYGDFKDEDTPSKDLKFDNKIYSREKADAFLIFIEEARELRHNSGAKELEFAVYERKIAEMTDEELKTREEYNQRSLEVTDFAYEQLGKRQPTRDISAGIEALLRTSNSFIGGLSKEKLEFYKSKGCDVHESLTEPLGKDLAVDYMLWLKDGETKHDTDMLAYAGENAYRSIKALMSIAEYERFREEGDEDEEGTDLFYKEHVVQSDEQKKNRLIKRQYGGCTTYQENIEQEGRQM
ncbi:hypothetical protein ACFLZZ_00245 [Nanoarchaeota archaeon]